MFVKALVVCNSWGLLHRVLDIDLSSLFSFCEDHSQEHFLGSQNIERDRQFQKISGVCVWRGVMVPDYVKFLEHSRIFHAG